MLTLVDDQKIRLLPEIYIPDARQQETCDGVFVPHNSKVGALCWCSAPCHEAAALAMLRCDC